MFIGCVHRLCSSVVFIGCVHRLCSSVVASICDLRYFDFVRVRVDEEAKPELKLIDNGPLLDEETHVMGEEAYVLVEEDAK